MEAGKRVVCVQVNQSINHTPPCYRCDGNPRLIGHIGLSVRSVVIPGGGVASTSPGSHSAPGRNPGRSRHSRMQACPWHGSWLGPPAVAPRAPAAMTGRFPFVPHRLTWVLNTGPRATRMVTRKQDRSMVRPHEPRGKGLGSLELHPKRDGISHHQITNTGITMTTEDIEEEASTGDTDVTAT